MAYSDKVLDHYENPRNVGSFDKGDDSVGTGMVGAPACGDVMKLQIKVNKDGIIEDARFKTYGCGSAIASSSLVTEWVKGKKLDEAAGIKNTQIAAELSLPPVKIHCSILAEDAIKAAVEDYKKKTPVTHGRHAHRKSRDARPELPRQARQGRGAAPGRAHHRLLRAWPTSSSTPTRSTRTTSQFESHGVKVVIDPKSLPLPGRHPARLCPREGLNEGFKFNNPNVKDECGCGESFNV